jgi:hypothetical protein
MNLSVSGPNLLSQVDGIEHYTFQVVIVSD